MMRVKNILTRTSARMLKRNLRKYIQGTFLKVGNRKIPIGKISELADIYAEQARYLQSLGVLEIISATPDVKLSPVAMVNTAKAIEEKKVSKLVTLPLSTDSTVVEFDDFVIISNSKDITSLPGLKDKNKVITPVEEPKEEPKKEEKIVESFIKINEEVKEEVKEETPVEEVKSTGRICLRKKGSEVSVEECEELQKTWKKKCKSCEYLA